MTLTLYRIQTDSHCDTILQGLGAQRHGGRWNARGRPMVYLATTPELCLLEYLVHLNGTPVADLPPLILCEVTVPADGITNLATEQLPVGWNDPDNPIPGLPAFAEAQFQHFRTMALAVPSAIMPLSPSRNILLDPLHPRHQECAVVGIHPYPMDPRLPSAS